MRCAQLESMTEQEVFNKTYETLRARGWKQAIGELGCMYRSPIGPCAAGVHIPDDEYSKHFENNGWGALVSSGMVTKAHANLIRQMQIVHDRHGLPMEMYMYMRNIARAFNLSIPGEV